MKQISETAIGRIQKMLAEPDLSGTKYTLLQKLGSGGMAEVYLVHDGELNRQAAMKVIDPLQSGEEVGERMIQEAKVIAQLEHPAVVPVHDVGILHDGRVFYVMKYVQGERLDVHAARSGAISDRLLVFLKICDAVGFAHSRGVIHRDLKPQNIMVGAFGEVQVMDWGLAKVLREAAAELITPAPVSDLASTKTGPGSILGTPGYMAPEQARGEVFRINEKSDIYSLGAILYFLLTLTAPENRLRPRQINEGIARPLEAICLKAMSELQEDRYSSVGEMSRDINSYLNGFPVTAYPENIFEKLGRWLSRNSFFVYLLLAYLIMRVLLLLVSK